MKITRGKKIGHITKIPSGSIREYRQHPGDDRSAIYAAAHYAKKNGEPMVVVPGNSYGSFVLRIARESEDLSSHAPAVGDKEVNVYSVTTDGEVYEAIATRK